MESSATVRMCFQFINKIIIFGFMRSILTTIFVFTLIFLQAQLVNFIEVKNNEKRCTSEWIYEVCHGQDTTISVTFGLYNNQCVFPVDRDPVFLFFESKFYSWIIEYQINELDGMSGLQFNRPSQVVGCDIISYTLPYVPQIDSIYTYIVTQDSIIARKIPGPSKKGSCVDCFKNKNKRT
jgi:hypothetical protein